MNWQPWRERLRATFAVDLRTLALFRFLLGSVVAVDMVNRLCDLRVFHTDWGLMPRADAEALAGPLRLSIHFINGDAWFAALLLIVEGLAALALAFGYRTRLAGAIAFALEASLLNRNSMILLGADTLMTCLLFWSLFLPVHARWSVDAALSRTPPPESHRHFSAGSVGLILQVLSVYFFSALLKSSPEWWPDGTAVYYTMTLDRYSSALGRHLLDYPRLMHGLTYFVYFLELLGPPLALSPVLQRPLRFAVMIALMCMHTGFILFMRIGHFPFVSLTSLTVLLGGGWWDWAARRLDHGRWLKIYYDGECAFCLKSCLLFRHFMVLPNTEIMPAQDSVRASALMQAQYSWVVIDSNDVAHTKWNAFVALLRHSLLFRWLAPLAGLRLWERPGTWTYDWVARHRAAWGRLTALTLRERSERWAPSRAGQWVAALYVAVLLAWNLTTVHWLPASVAESLRLLVLPPRLDQSWVMFAPRPWTDDGWYVIPGTLEDGTEIDVNTRRPLTYEKPEAVDETEPDVRWRTYHTIIWLRDLASQRKYYASWLCRVWNRDAPPGRHLLSFKLVYMLERSVPQGQVPLIEQRILWRQECVAADQEPEGAPGENEQAPLKNDKPV